MLYENKEYEKSRILLQKILKEDAANYGLWEQLLFCDLYLEDYQALSKNSEDAVDLFPSYPLPYFFAGIANFRLKDYVKSKAFLESGKEFVVNNNALLEQFYSTLGDTYNELENYEASYTAYDKALILNPENSVVLNNYAYYLSLRSVNLDNGGDTSGVVLEHFGDIYYKMDQKDEAINYWKKAKEKKDHSDFLDKKIKDGILYE